MILPQLMRLADSEAAKGLAAKLVSKGCDRARATREALLEVQAILHEAGWDAPPKPAGTPEQRLDAIRSYFSTLFDEKDLGLLLPALGMGIPVAEAGKPLGLTPTESEARFRDALGRLCEFAETVEAQGFASRS